MSSATPTSRPVVLTAPSADATQSLARRLASVARPGDLICLWGELGAGKTVFAKGFGAGLGVTATINSPTFVLMAEYEGRLPFFHLDLYRLVDAADALAGGLFDNRQEAGVTLVEWPDRLGAALPADRLDVRLDGSADEPRRITVVAWTPDLERYLAAAGATA
jgi:tRNA threonylcarbamoyladenosine biosynthesis protein TsaE